MKVVNTETFLALPPNIIFSKYAPCTFINFLIKGETILDEHDVRIDFYYQQIIDSVKCQNTEELFDILIDSQDNGTSFNVDFNNECRDGLFNKQRLYVIWEINDIKQLIDRLYLCIK